MSAAEQWIDICSVDDLVANSGVCALVGSRQVALFYLPEQARVYALDNYDPVGHANVLSRGILGSVGERLIVASPLYKEQYCLETGQCLDNEALKLDTWQTRLEGGRLLLDQMSAPQLAQQKLAIAS